MINVQMGEIGFELTGKTDTKEKVIEFFQNIGFTLVEKVPYDNISSFSRATKFTDNQGLTFKVIWYVNQCDIQIGEWGKSFIEIPFTKIIGSYLPCADHLTLAFINRDRETGKIAICTKESR